MTELFEQKCEHENLFSLDERETKELLNQIRGWRIEDDVLIKEFIFNSFFEGINFANKIAVVSEQENHHPTIILEPNKVTIQLTTHKRNALTKNDFIMASKIDYLLK